MINKQPKLTLEELRGPKELRFLVDEIHRITVKHKEALGRCPFEGHRGCRGCLLECPPRGRPDNSGHYPDSAVTRKIHKTADANLMKEALGYIRKLVWKPRRPLFAVNNDMRPLYECVLEWDEGYRMELAKVLWRHTQRQQYIHQDALDQQYIKASDRQQAAWKEVHRLLEVRLYLSELYTR